jgi:Ca-activated chloride channel homolog
MSKFYIGSAFFLLTACITMHAVTGEEEVAPKAPFTYSINAGLVLLPVTIFDKSGRAVLGLEKKDFEIYEDGVPQPIEVFDNKDAPVAVGLVLDNSDSMAPKRVEASEAALKLAELSNPEDQIFIVHFHELVVFGLPVGNAFTRNISELKQAISQVAGAGRTALYDAVIAGLEHVELSNLPKRVLILVSDGGDNASRHSEQEVLEAAEHSNAQIYSIGIYDPREPSKNPKLLKRLAGITGGEAFFPASLSRLSEICKKIAADIRSQYTIGYVPANQDKGGVFRNVRVAVKGSPDRGKFIVRTRSGYKLPEP